MDIYKVDEILTQAMAIEETGEKFYALLAKRLNHTDLKDIFQAMSRQEVGHYELYKKLREQLPAQPDTTQDATTDFDPQKHRLLQDRIFNRLEVVSKTAKLRTLGDALSYLIDIEMDVVDFFENFRKLIKTSEQPVLINIINEERAHVKQLVNLRQRFQNEALRQA